MSRSAIAFGVLLVCAATLGAQTIPQAAPQALPRLILFSGQSTSESPQRDAGPTTVSFAVYEEQTGGVPLWMETQTVTLDARGKFSVLLGSTTEGMPADLFSTNAARWLGVTVQGEAEQPRVMFLSVPYALKAAEADTLAGKSVSDFVLTSNLKESIKTAMSTQPIAAGSGTGIDGGPATNASFTLNYLQKGNGTAAVDSAVIESAGNVGIGTATPSSLLHIASGLSGGTNLFTTTNSNSDPYGPLFLVFKDSVSPANNDTMGYFLFRGRNAGAAVRDYGMFYAASDDVAAGSEDGSFHFTNLVGGAEREVLTLRSGNVGIGTTTPSSPLHLASSGAGGNNLFTVTNSNGDGYGPLFMIQKDSPSPANNDTMGYFLFRGRNSGAAVRDYGMFYAASDTVTAGVESGSFHFTNLVGGAEREVMTLKSGNLGVGTNAPAYKFDVLHGGATGARIASSVSFSVLDIDSVGGDSALRFMNNATAQWNIRNRPADNYLEIFEMNGGGSRMVIQDGTGHVGIGETTSPAYRLDVLHGGSTGVRSRSSAGYSVFDVDAFDGDAAVRFATGGTFKWLIRNNPSDNDSLRFYNFGTGSERMRIDGLTGGLVVAGSFTAGGTKAFSIDHPLDPENQILMHAAAESNEVINFYSGNVTTDGNGKATVRLPDYFEAINTDFRYQLTVIGTFAQAIVESEVQDNQFRIATDKPGVKVSWEVKGVRNDAYMRAHPFQAERLKAEGQRGADASGTASRLASSSEEARPAVPNLQAVPLNLGVSSVDSIVIRR